MSFPVGTQVQERYNYTRDQVEQHIADALEIAGNDAVPWALRAAVFTEAVRLLSGKQVIATVPQPVDLAHMIPSTGLRR